MLTIGSPSQDFSVKLVCVFKALNLRQVEPEDPQLHDARTEWTYALWPTVCWESF